MTISGMVMKMPRQRLCPGQRRKFVGWISLPLFVVTGHETNEEELRNKGLMVMIRRTVASLITSI